MTAPARVQRLSGHVMEITIHEGKKRQVRRMCEEVGHPIRSLVRVQFGPLRLGELQPGRSRRLTARDQRPRRRGQRAGRRGGVSDAAAAADDPREVAVFDLDGVLTRRDTFTLFVISRLRRRPLLVALALPLVPLMVVPTTRRWAISTPCGCR